MKTNSHYNRKHPKINLFFELKFALEAHTPVNMASTQYSYSIVTFHKLNGIFKSCFSVSFSSI